MCLPLKLIQSCLSFSCILVISLGIISIVTSLTIGNNEEFFSDADEARKIIISVSIAFGTFLIILGFIGLFGFYKKSSICLAIYNLGMLVFFILFLIVTIVCFVIFKNFYSEGTSICSDQSWLIDIDNYVIISNTYLCSKECPCYIDNYSYLRNKIIINMDETNKVNSNQTNLLYFSMNGSIKIQECLKFSNIKKENENYIEIMNYFERNYDCAGVCSKLDYFTFSDINKKEPNEMCSVQIKEIIIKYSKGIGAVTLVISIFLLLIIIFSFCLCCHPEKKNKEKSNFIFLLNYL